MTFSITAPAAIQELLDPIAFDRYGKSTADTSNLGKLGGLAPSDLFEKPPTDKMMAKCCLSGLWLLHNFLDESHSISQDIKTAEGSFWHAIMHRMEGDFSNAKYWYRNVGEHPAKRQISSKIGNAWDPNVLVDRCQAESRQGKLSFETHRLTVIEWQTLFSYCYGEVNQ